MRAWIRLTALAIGCAAAALGCGTKKPVCSNGCGPNQECVADGTCGCRPGYSDCDGLAANGCEYQGATCPACAQEIDSAACARAGKSCGEVDVVDRCGKQRRLSCGECREGMQCGLNAPNVCGTPGCDPEKDVDFCMRLGKDCGEVSADDNCANPRVVDCGTCPEGQTCGGAGIDNLCSGSCVPETNEAFCARLRKECGTLAGFDNCGRPRSVGCGTCADGRSCTSDLVCVTPPVPEDGNCIGFDGGVLPCASGLTCLHNGETGPLLQGACKRICDQASDCAAPKVCAFGTVRGGGGVCGTPKPPRASGCTDFFKGSSFCWEATEPEGALLTCVGGVCVYVCDYDGNTTGPLPCPSGQSCSGVEVGNPAIAACMETGCPPESTTDICARVGAQCGSLSTTDCCGKPRLAECGTCADATESCGANGFLNTCGSGACVPELDDGFCARLGRNCGRLSATDNCGDERTVDCGACDGNASCGATTPNVCGCAESDATFCARQGATCGQVSGQDNCGLQRTVNCGACAVGRSCDATQHQCVATVVPENGNCLASNGALLSCAAGLTCLDNGQTGFQRQAACKKVCQHSSDCAANQTCTIGSLPGDYGVCATPKAPGDSGCQDFYEGPSFCWTQDAWPGMALICLAGVCNYVCDFAGNTGAPLPCPPGSTCNPSLVPEPYYVPLATCERTGCSAETDAQLCTRLGTDCGTVASADNCGKPRVADCGTCSGGKSCGAQQPNVCGTGSCAPESDASFCARLGKNCGMVGGKDNCGASRSVNCGSCTGGLSCGASGTPNVCACSESSAALCTRVGATCGPVPDAVDSCGVTRTVNCGACAPPTACDPDQHACSSNVVQENASCLGTSPGTYLPCAAGLGCVYTTQGTPTAVCKRICASAGECPPGQTCSLGLLGSGDGVCGTLKAPGETGCDNFWTSGSFCWEANEPTNSILECIHGACTYICGYEDGLGTWHGGFDCPAGVTCSQKVQEPGYYPISTCEISSCAVESDQQLCTRLGADCGSVGGADTCGQVRTVTSCGTCTVAGESCGAGGYNNVCGYGYCFPEANADFCVRLGKDCGPVSATDNCGTSRSNIACGSCTSPKTCGAVTPNVCD